MIGPRRSGNPNVIGPHQLTHVYARSGASFYTFSEMRYELYFREEHKIPLMGRISNKEILTKYDNNKHNI